MRVTKPYGSGMALMVFGAVVVAGPAGPLRAAADKAPAFWNVDDIKAGMKGQGRTVFRGVKVEPFDVEVLGVLKKVDPRRDLVIVRCGGANLEQTGVLGGMSGSPVFIDGKLLGAVAYTWAFSKVPLAGITPIQQMTSFVKDLELDPAPKSLGDRTFKLERPLAWEDRQYEEVRVSDVPAVPADGPAKTPTLTPIVTPVVTSGIAAPIVSYLNQRLGKYGLVFVQGGTAGQADRAAAAGVPLEPGSPLGVALMLGDCEMAGVGTATHLDGDTLYAWGHPFFGMGPCELVVTSGFIHTVVPSVYLSFKMGTVVEPIGTLRYDTATAIVGRLGPPPPLVPIRTTVARGRQAPTHTYRMRIVRQKELLPFLTLVALANTFANEGGLPTDITIKLRAEIAFKQHNPLVVEDVYAGSLYAGELASFSVFQEVLSRVFALTDNPFEEVEITGVTCDSQTYAGRRTAEIQSLRLDRSEVVPGDELVARVVLRAYKGEAFVEPLTLPLPKDIPPGRYELTVCDAPTYLSMALADRPHKQQPRNIGQLFELVRLRARRNALYARVPLPAVGVSIDGRELPALPASALALMARHQRTGMGLMRESLSAEKPTDWVIEGAHRVPFTVVEEKRTQY